jgi:exosortase/archaeosortase family protein
MLAAENGSFAIDIAAPCSGLRSLFALMALTAAYAYLNQRTWFRRALLFAMSVPIAVAGNVMRILSICLVAATASSEFATGFYHDHSGYVVFIAAIVMMVGAGEIISRIGGAKARAAATDSRAEATASPAAAPARVSAFGWTVAGAAFALVISAMALLSSSPRPVLCEISGKRLGEISGFVSEAVEPSTAELEVLPRDTKIDERVYTADNGVWHLVSMVVGGRSKSSIHRPELCLPAQGFMMEGARTANVGGVDWRIMRIRSGVEEPRYFAYTFFNQAGYRTASHTDRIFRDVWDRSVHNRIDRWVMVTVNSTGAVDAGLEEFLAKVAEVVE